MSVSSQTESESGAAVQVCERKTAGYEMVVDRQLHPAQAEAVERAERAAEQLWSACESRLRQRYCDQSLYTLCALSLRPTFTQFFFVYAGFDGGILIVIVLREE